MGRLIDADELLKYLSVMYDRQNDEDEPFNCAVLAMSYHIKEAPTIEVPQWIPCSERLPEYLEEVLMSTFWGVRVGFRDHTERSGDFWNIIENDSTVAPHSVYAWMPLPKPYEEGDHD